MKLRHRIGSRWKIHLCCKSRFNFGGSNKQLYFTQQLMWTAACAEGLFTFDLDFLQMKKKHLNKISADFNSRYYNDDD